MAQVARELDSPQVGHVVATVFSGRLPDPGAVNAGLVQGLAMLQGTTGVRRSHFFHGRSEYLYVERACIAEIAYLPCQEPMG